MKRHTLVLHNSWALGDTVCLSALARDIQLAYPGQYHIQMSGHYSGVAWLNNPHCEKAPDNPTGQLVRLQYHDGIIHCNNGGAKKHFLSWFHHSFEQKTGLPVPVTKPKGDIHLSAEEQKIRPDGRYWVVVCGGKMDMTAKVWSAAYWQQTVDILTAQGIRVVQAGHEFDRHFHPKLERVEHLVGKTRNERHFFSLIAGAEGVICGVTAAMHIAAVFDKPCVVLAGGREAPWWEAYTNCYFPTSFGPKCEPVKVEHTYLHTIGLLDCGIGNLDRGCWKDRTVPLEQADHTVPKKMHKLCKKPVAVGHQMVPECMRMITPDHVVEAVMNYYEKGVLPPIGTPKKVYSLPTLEDLGIDLEAEKKAIAAEPKPASDPLKLGPPPAWNPNWTKELPKAVEPRKGEPASFAAMDHPYVGGRFTLFVLGYGDNLGLIERCIGSILDTCPRHRFDLRVALNQPSPRVLAFVKGMVGSTVTKMYLDTGERRKYPAMREMFWDKACPIDTPYLCWFDDDSWCRKNDWMIKLTESIRANHPNQGRLYGAWHYHDLMGVKRPGAPRENWFKEATWWRGRNLYTGQGQRMAPNGSQIVFASGGFWALATHVVREADIPDVRLNHNGGDITIGCQVTQAGYKVVNFSPKPGKEIIAWSDSPRRGFREDFPWA